MKTYKSFCFAMLLALMLSFIPLQVSSAAVLPPKNFFKFPFGAGVTWRMTGGPHPDNGSTGVFSSLDFKPYNHSGCTVPTNEWVTAAAAGNVIYNSASPYKLIIDHGNGWKSQYMHLTNIQVKSGRVAKDQKIGNPSCLGGTATGVHVHFNLTYNGAIQPIVGATLEGWTVQSTSTSYEGCLKNDITKQNVCRQLYAVSNDPTKTFRSMRTIVDIRSVYSGKTLTVNKGSVPAYTYDSIIQKAWSGSQNQKWYIVPIDADYYSIISVDSGKCLDISSGSTSDGARVQQYSCNSTNAQKFKFINVSGNQFYIQAKCSGKVIDVTNWSKADIYIQQWKQEIQNNQYWVMSIR